MKKWLKRIRGALGLGLTWAAAWAVVGALIGIVFFGGGINVELLANALLFAVSGFVGGVGFSGILALAGGRRTFDEISLPALRWLGRTGGPSCVSAALERWERADVHKRPGRRRGDPDGRGLRRRFTGVGEESRSCP